MDILLNLKLSPFGDLLGFLGTFCYNHMIIPNHHVKVALRAWQGHGKGTQADRILLLQLMALVQLALCTVGNILHVYR
jgi:hypothetical protein